MALYYGHRISVDLDLFSSNPAIEKDDITETLTEAFGDDFVYEKDGFSPGIFCFIRNVKVDIVSYPHAPIFPIEKRQNVRLYALGDIAAMKINAILGRGAKKDFFDIFELLQHYPLKQLIDWYYEKYPKQILLISIPQALIYFADAEESEDPVSLNGQDWQTVKAYIEKQVRDFLS